MKRYHGSVVVEGFKALDWTCSLESGDCAHSVCGQALNPMTGVIVYL